MLTLNGVTVHSRTLTGCLLPVLSWLCQRTEVPDASCKR
jgi:hypothetical protein